MKMSACVFVFLCCLWPALTFAADESPKQSSSLAPTPMSRDAELRTLLRDLGARMHKHFVVDPRAPQSVDLGGLDPREISYPQLLSILEVMGLVAVAEEGVVRVVPNTDVRQMALPIVAPENIKTLDDEWVITIIPVKNINVAQLVPILRPLIPTYGHLAALPDRNALVLVDRSANVRRLVEIIRRLEGLPKAIDVPAPKSP